MITGVVMGHESRAVLIHRLVAQLGAHDVVCDHSTERSAHGVMIHALAAGIRTSLRIGHSHIIVAQDDAIPLPGANGDVLREIALANPDRLVALYVGNIHAVRTEYKMALRVGKRYVDLPRNHFVPTVALLWPLELAQRYVREDTCDPVEWPWDDESIRVWRQAYPDVEAVASIPCLFGHDNSVPSVMGHAHHGARHPMMTPSVYRGAWQVGW